MADDAFTAGLLHDIGRLVLASSEPRQYQQVVARAGGHEDLVCEAESQVIGSTHAEVGAYLLGLWGLPGSIVEAVAFHHRPRESTRATFCPLTAVHVAEALCVEKARAAQGVEFARLDMNYLNTIGMSHRVPAWCESCRDAMD